MIERYKKLKNSKVMLKDKIELTTSSNVQDIKGYFMKDKHQVAKYGKEIESKVLENSVFSSEFDLSLISLYFISIFQLVTNSQSNLPLKNPTSAPNLNNINKEDINNWTQNKR